MLTNKKTLGFRDVLISPSSSDIKSRKEVSLEREFTFSNGLKKTFVPIIAANMASIGTFKVAQVLAKYKMLTCLTKDVSYAGYRRLYKKAPEVFPYIAATVGLNEWQFLDQIQGSFPVDILCLDVANGYMQQFIDYVCLIRQTFPSKIIMAGNVATLEGITRLYEAGTDIVKVGIGSGSVCTTRYKTGVGVPQISAIDDCIGSNLKLSTKYLCSDGGCTGPGDVAKAFIAGADFVMLGGMLAGTTETGSIFSGSAWGNTEEYKTSEGKEVSLRVSETLEQRVNTILGGLRSTGSYIGQRSVGSFYKADLIQTNEQTNDIYGPPS